jgi:hypothetical protein
MHIYPNTPANHRELRVSDPFYKDKTVNQFFISVTSLVETQVFIRFPEGVENTEKKLCGLCGLPF